LMIWVSVASNFSFNTVLLTDTQYDVSWRYVSSHFVDIVYSCFLIMYCIVSYCVLCMYLICYLYTNASMCL
jgi:hypothetical protein